MLTTQRDDHIGESWVNHLKWDRRNTSFCFVHNKTKENNSEAFGMNKNINSFFEEMCKLPKLHNIRQ